MFRRVLLRIPWARVRVSTHPAGPATQAAKVFLAAWLGSLSPLAAQAPAPWIPPDDIPLVPSASVRTSPRPTPVADPEPAGPVPFNRLGKDNITVRVQTSSSVLNSQKASSANDETPLVTLKTVEVELTDRSPEPEPAVVEFYFVSRTAGRDTIDKPKIRRCETGSGTFSFQAKSVVPPKQSSRSSRNAPAGTFVAGWFVRVLRDDRVVGYAGSAPSYELLAQDPRRLAEKLK